MEIVFIGAGRLATQLAKALHEKGHAITAVYSRTLASASALSREVGSMATDHLASLPLRADAYIIAIKDSALATVIPQLVKGREDQTFFHTAGSMPLQVFEGHATHAGVFYPMQTFSKERPVDFSHLPLFIEATDEATLRLADTLARSVSDNVRAMSSDARRYLHLAAVFACNFVNHCYALSAEILQRHDIPFDVMLPLIDETASKVKALSPREAQTGPAVRYDENVINAQLELLSDTPDIQQLYALMSKSIHSLSSDERNPIPKNKA